MEDLENIIEDATNDSVAAEETSSIEVSAPGAGGDAEVESIADDTTATEAAPTDNSVADDFAKKYGLVSESVTGRENRIPYSRVKKIIQNKEQEFEKLKKELDGNYTPKLAEYETKVKDYEARLEQVAQFESILENDPQQFLQMLSQVPAYKGFFEYIGSLAAPGGGQTQQPASYLDNSTMPQPDQVLSDGSRVYSLEGLAKRDEWLARQVEDRAIKAAEERIAKRYAPIEEEWQTQRRINEALPKIQRDIDEARTWPLFNENEADIVAALRADRNMTLQGAYMKVVTPKLQTNRDEMRKSILAELKQRPASTAAPASTGRSQQAHSGEPRNLLDIVQEAANSLK